MTALDEVIYRIRWHEASGMVAAENLARLAEEELIHLRAAVLEMLAVIEPMIKEENNPSWPGITPQDCKAATAWVDKFQDLLKRVDQK